MTLIVIAIVVCVVVIIYFFMTSAQKPENGTWIKNYQYAHRGLHNEHYPENSLEAFENAIKNNYAIELDVQLSKDDEIMVFHDKELLRMTGRQGKASEFTVEELQAMKLQNTISYIPTLKQVLKTINGKVPVLIETKNEGKAGLLEIKLYEMMKDYQGKFAVQSFSPFSIGWFKKNAPEVLRGQLSCCFSVGAGYLSKIKTFLLCYLFTNFLCRPNFISYEVTGIKSMLIKRMKENGIPILVWVERTPEEFHEYKKYVDTEIFEDFMP
ncbi:MAG: glycerophosphodiester phosphodiesterase family protein [Christensenellaceae bacterium]